MNTVLVDYFRCPERFAELEVARDVSGSAGYFTSGAATCYGRLAGEKPARHVDGRLPEIGGDAFDFSEVVTNLREERYRQQHGRGFLDRFTETASARRLYYFLRPVLSVPVRKHLQRARLAGWRQIAFPRWPVDTTVETLMRQAMGALLTKRDIRRIPFIWFWPDAAPGCVMMTHDVEDSAGREFCGQLMTLDESFGIKSAFQLVPEMRGESSKRLGEEIRARGFEVNLHDLNHDGYLFQDRAKFLERAAQINRYAEDLGCRGFRSGAMYREQQWYDAFDFSFDMSVPNVAHLEPQRGGCCTVMPYFIGKILELPLTTTQDYSLFHILGDYSLDLWKTQAEMILANHGLMSFITHPDYLIEKRARAVYLDLLGYLAELGRARNLWLAPPGDVDQWWRNRQQQRLIPDGDSWRVVGPDSERARVAYASLVDNCVTYTT